MTMVSDLGDTSNNVDNVDSNGNSNAARGTKRDAGEFDGSSIEDEIPNVDYANIISDKRALEYIDGTRRKPMEVLQQTLDDTRQARDKVAVGQCVIYWYKSQDLRTSDNRGLSQAYEYARDHNVPLVCVFVVCKQQLYEHIVSPLRIDFVKRSLHILHDDLQKLNIPLSILTTDKIDEIPRKLITEFAQEYNCRHIFANIEYEVDELRRDTKVVTVGLDHGVAVHLAHDTCVVNPNELLTKTSEKPFSVFTPYYKAWVAHLCQHTHTLQESTRLQHMPPSSLNDKLLTKEGLQFPELPPDLQLQDAEYWAELWPAGEHVALEKLRRWVDGRIERYRDDRDLLGEDQTTSYLSVYFSSGNLAARTAVRLACDVKDAHEQFGRLRSIMNMNSSGQANWTSELAWRDFYRNILVNFPYVCMHKPFKLKTGAMKWSDNVEHYRRWTQGRTGFPIVDAAMRQLRRTGYMHNRGRMIVASFLTKHLLVSWQWGEYFFMRHLVDGDFASNNGGWGFSSSCGVDAQPYFRIFNPYRQSERFDPDAKYIRRWLPELDAAVPLANNNAIHDPYNRNFGDAAKKSGYPPPMVSHNLARKTALDTFKEHAT